MQHISRHCEELATKQSISPSRSGLDCFATLAMTCIIAFLLTACQTLPPTSERLEAIRAEKQDALAAELAETGLELGQPVFIRIFKQEQRLETWVYAQDTARFEPFKAYDICKFSGTLGPKLAEGDRQAPEGFYDIRANQMNPWSQFHLSFNLGFPNEYDRAHGRTGSLLMVHGDCKSEGCYAMTDPAIEDVYLLTEASIAAGHPVPVHAFPFRMTPRNMALHVDHEWIGFWENLREGYDAFELSQIPPKITLQDHAYQIRRGTKQRRLF